MRAKRNAECVIKVIASSRNIAKCTYNLFINTYAHNMYIYEVYISISYVCVSTYIYVCVYIYIFECGCA